MTAENDQEEIEEASDPTAAKPAIDQSARPPIVDSPPDLGISVSDVSETEDGLR